MATPQGQKTKPEVGQTKKDAGPAKNDTGQAARGAAGGGGVGEDKPKTTRAERRAKQEAERAAKEAGLPKVSSPPAVVVLLTVWHIWCRVYNVQRDCGSVVV